MKICSKCGIEKPLAEFYKDDIKLDGVKNECKECNKTKCKEYRDTHKEEISKYHKNYNKCNEEVVKERNRKYREDNKDEILKRQRDNYSDDSKSKKSLYNETNREYINNRQREYDKLHQEEITEQRKLRRDSDPLYRLKCNIRGLIKICIKNGGYPKKSKTADILGCTFEEFYAYIENQFTEGMSWDNRELWHLDHIYPVSLAESEEHLIQLNNYNNFQPMWAEDNLRKGNKTIDYMKKVLYNIIQQNKLNTTT